jgi:6-phosphogluconate dehydrogenase
MAGGDEATYKIVEPILMDLAAKAEYGPCCGWFGPGMAGHRVKNVHNGIEYDFMMCMAEVYATLRAGDLPPEEIADIFEEWIEQIPELKGYLMDIAVLGLRVKAEDGTPLVLDVLDEAKAKGTGKFTSKIAMDEGIPIPGIDMAVVARCLSAFCDDRERLSGSEGPRLDLTTGKEELCGKLRDALFCNMIMSYDHGMMLLGATEKEHGYKIDRVKAAEVWRGGCIINSHLLPRIRDAYQADDGRFTLMDAPFFKEQLDQRQQNWREATATMMLARIPCLASYGNLGAYDSLRTAKLDAASFNQMLRDTFGDHTFRRFSVDGVWTCDWDGDGTITRLK